LIKFVVLSWFWGLFLSCSGQSQKKKSNIDSVRLELLRELWSEPSSYGQSGSTIPDDWKVMFENKILSNDISENDNSLREKLLDHISVRSSILLNSLPEDTNWFEYSNFSVQDLYKFRIVYDETWNNEFIQPTSSSSSSCLTLENIVADMLHRGNDDDLLSESQSDHNNELMDHDITTTSSHKDRILKLENTFHEWPKVIIAIKDTLSNHYTILDGNHRALLMVDKHMKKKDDECISNADESGHSSISDSDTVVTVISNGEVEKDEETRLFVGEIQAEDFEGMKLWKFWRSCSK
jgi:hypothetical protein